MPADAPDNRRKSWLGILSPSRWRIRLLLAALGVVLLTAIGTLANYAIRAQRYDLEAVGRQAGPGMLYDSENRPIAPLDAGEVAFVPWDEFPQHLINAFVAREDENFFSHSGVVLSSVLRSMIRNLLSMSYQQGASTITMQLTRNVYELQNKTMDRKLLEVALAQRIERRYSKKTILTQYLNRIYFGHHCYGIGAAARHYFNKPVSALNLVECATLAGLVRAPSLCNPETSPSNAEGVKRETLARMLDQDMISQQEYEKAVETPIELNINNEHPASSYTTMEAREEMEELSEQMKDAGGGLSVVTSFNLGMQQYLEEACERALSSVENRGVFPDVWLAQFDSPEQAEAAAKAYRTAKRPRELKKRGSSNDLSDLVQCCVMVIDSRINHKGELMAITGGRSAVDERNRWDDRLMPGKAWAPFVYCTACLPGGEDRHIVARDAVVTGSSIGYDVVRAFAESLKLNAAFPDRAREQDLYNGIFELRRRDLANLLFSLQNQGRGYGLRCIRYVWSRSGKPLYANQPERAPEYIRRESAVSVAGLPPFVTQDTRQTELSVTLPEGHGQWHMIINDRGVCVFVWMGFDNPEHPLSQTREMSRLLRDAASYLARELHTEGRRVLREQMAREKEEEEKKKQQTL